MSFDAHTARTLTHEARVTQTVNANLEEVKKSAAAGYRFGYFQRPYNDEQVNREAAAQLAGKGFRAEAGYVEW